jgi:DNA-binding beta-propeller fold protein YncE
MMETLDCRGQDTPTAGRALIARYNAAAPNTHFHALVDGLAPGLRMWLLEAGVRHTASKEEDGWRLAIERRASPAQGSIPGLHHVVASGDSVWACERAARVARFDAESGNCVAARAVARKASHLAFHAASRTLFVADAEGCEVIALRADDLGEIARWDAPGMPQLPLVTPDGVVCVTGGATGTVTLAWPMTTSYRTRTVTVGASPHDPCADASGEHLFVPCSGEATIVKVRLTDGAVVGRIAVGDGPSHLALHPDGERLYSANSWDGSVTSVSVDGELLGHASSGGWAHAIEVSPHGRLVYVANFFDDTLAVFDARSLERLALLPTEPYPHGLDVSPDGRHLVATGFHSDCVRIYDARAPRDLARVAVGGGSSHTAFTDDRNAWIGCSVSDHRACIDLRSMQARITAATPNR